MKLILIKSIHTLVWAVFVSTIGYVLWCGIMGTVGPEAWLAVAAVAGEGLVLLVFKGKCPLTILARKYSDSRKDNFDIYLPNWLAKYNKLIFTTIFAIGVCLMLLSYL